MASFWKKITSGLDFWDKKENRGQREQYAREDREEEERRRREHQARASMSRGQQQQPGTVFSPTTSNILDTPLKKPGVTVGTQADFFLSPQKAANPILAQVKPQTPEQVAETRRKTAAKKELDDLVAEELPKAMQQEKSRTSWAERALTDRNWNKRAEVAARNRALTRYQEKYGYSKQPEVLETLKENRETLDRASKGGSSKLLAPVLSAGRVGTGIVEGGAGVYDLLTPGKGQNRLTKASVKKAQEIDQLANDMDMESLYKGLNVPLEVASYFIPSTIVGKSGKVGSVLRKAGAKVDAAGKLLTKNTKAQRLIREGSEEFFDPQNLQKEIELTGRYMGQDSARGEDLNAGDVGENAAQAVGGAFIPAFVRRGLKKLRGGQTAADVGATTTGTAASRIIDGVSNTTPEASMIPGTVPNIPEPGIAPPKVKVADGVQTTPNIETLRAQEANNTPAYLRGFGSKPVPEPTPQDLYKADQSTARRQTSQAGQTYDAGLDPNNPIDSIPAFQRRGIEASPETQIRINELQRQLETMPSDTDASTIIFNLRKRYGEQMRANPSMANRLRQQLEATVSRVRQNTEARARAQAELDSLTLGTSNAPVNASIPDPTSPRALGKADEGADSMAPVADFSNAVQAPLVRAPATGVDAAGNPAMTPDVQRAREMNATGVVPTPEPSPVAATEEAMQRADDAAARAQTGTTAPEERLAFYTNPRTGENIGLRSDDLIDEIIDLQSIPKDRLTVDEANTLRDLLNIYRNWDEMSVPMTRPTTDELYPDMSPAGREAVESTMEQLGAARTANQDLKRTRSEERGDRIAAGDAAYEAAGGGEAGMRAKMGALKGEYSKSEYEPVRISEEARTEVLDDIQRSDKLRPFEKMSTQRAFEKMWGVLDEKPLPSDIRKIRSYYNSKQQGLGDLVADKLKEATKGGEDFKLVEQLAGTPRTLMTTLDFSSPRQAGVLMARHPIYGTKAFLNGVINAFRPGRFNKAVDEMVGATDPNGANYSDFMNDVMGLQLPSVADQVAEEAMSSTPLLSKVPIYGQVIKASNRSFSGTLSELRFNVAKNWIDNHGGIDNVMKEYSAKDLEDLGEALNTLSGRGGKRGGFVDKHASILSKTLFSGRLWASRLNMLNPYWYYRLSPPARMEAMTSAASFAALAGTVLTVAERAGAEVETDPRSADFGKIKVGNTRYDIMGGLQQNIRVASQVLTGTKINSATGEEEDTTIAKAVGGFVEGKLNPLLGFAWKMAKSSDFDDGNPLTRTDEYGNEVNVGWEGAKLGLPLPLSEIGDTAQDVGSVGKAALMNLPGFFGAGVQTYGDSNNKPLTRDKAIEAAMDNEEYDRAIQGYQHLMEKENSKREPNKKRVEELQEKIEKAELKRDDIPTDKDMVKTYAENGEFDKAIRGTEYVMRQMEKDKKLAKSDKEAMQMDIKRFEVTRDGKYPPEIMKMYESIGVEDWRKMDDPDSELYDPDMFELLAQYDEHLKKHGASRKGDGKLNKYYASKGGSGGGKGRGVGGGGKGKEPRFLTSVAMQSFNEGGTFKPIKVQSAEFAPRESGIPIIAPVPNYDASKLKKISVSRGGR